MATSLTINGVAYSYPTTGDVRWGANATAWASAVTTGMLQKAGGTFQLLADVNFGTTYGILSQYYKTRTANIAATGQFRLARADQIVWRNQANSADLVLEVNASDQLLFNGESPGFIDAVGDTATIDLTITGSTLTADIVALSITNAMINASAAIAFSKLAALSSGNILVGSAGNVATSVAMSGDATIIASGALTIANNAVSNAKSAQMATLTIKGNNTGGTANALDLTVTQTTAILNSMVGDSGAGGTKGLVPAPASGDAAANKFLKADGSWSAPTGAGDVVGPASSTDNGFAKFDGTTGKLIKDSAATISNGDVNASAAIAVNKLAASTASRALVSDGSGFISAATTTATEIGFVNGVTSSIQTQISANQLRSVLTAKGDLYAATASNTVDRLAVGTNGFLLQANSSTSTGLQYVTPNNSTTALVNIGVTATVAASALTISLKTLAGADASSTDPIFIGFRNATSATGQGVIRSITGALSLVISSGSTLGQRNGVASYVYVYAIDNAGTSELAVSRNLYDEGSIVTTVAEGGAGAADSASTIYSTTARVGVALRIVSRFLSDQATAGTWASAPSEISLVPFQFASISALMGKTSNQNPGTTAATKVTFQSVASSEQCYDPLSICDTANSRLVCSKIGKHDLIMNISLSNFEASTSLQVYIYKNGVSFLRFDVDNAGVGTTRSVASTFPVDATAIGDYFEIFTASAADASYSINGNTGVDSKSFFGLNYKGL